MPGPAYPVFWVNHFFSARPAGVQFLIRKNGSPLMKYQFTTVFKRILSHLGLNPLDFGMHSFHFSAAMEAAQVGLPNNIVKRIGRSKCFSGYIRPGLLLQ